MWPCIGWWTDETEGNEVMEIGEDTFVLQTTERQLLYYMRIEIIIQ